jgi:hypothetical protein
MEIEEFSEKKSFHNLMIDPLNSVRMLALEPPEMISKFPYLCCQDKAVALFPMMS